MPKGQFFFATHNYFEVLSQETAESDQSNNNRKERKLGTTLNPAMRDNNFIEALKVWSRDHGDFTSDSYFSFHEFLERYPQYFHQDHSTGLLSVKNCIFKLEWFSYPVEAIDMVFDKQSAFHLPLNTYFERCEFRSKDDSIFVLENKSLLNCSLIGNFNKANISGCHLEKLDCTSASLKDSHFKHNTLKGVNFSGLSLHRAVFDNVNVSACNFAYADMTKVKILNHSRVYASNFQKANMELFQLGMKNVHFVHPDKSEVNNCDFTEANLRDAHISCDAIFENTVFNATLAADAVEMYQGFFPPADCLIPHISNTCSDLYENRETQIRNQNGNITCQDIMPASSCESDVEGLSFGFGLLYVQPIRDTSDRTVSPPPTNQAILYGQPGYKSTDVRNAFHQEGMRNSDKTKAASCEMKVERGLDITVYAFLGAFALLMVLHYLYSNVCKNLTSEENQPLVLNDDSGQEEDERTQQQNKRCFGRRTC